LAGEENEEIGGVTEAETESVCSMGEGGGVTREEGAPEEGDVR